PRLEMVFVRTTIDEGRDGHIIVNLSVIVTPAEQNDNVRDLAFGEVLITSATGIPKPGIDPNDRTVVAARPAVRVPIDVDVVLSFGSDDTQRPIDESNACHDGTGRRRVS